MTERGRLGPRDPSASPPMWTDSPPYPAPNELGPLGGTAGSGVFQLPPVGSVDSTRWYPQRNPTSPDQQIRATDSVNSRPPVMPQLQTRMSPQPVRANRTVANHPLSEGRTPSDIRPPQRAPRDRAQTERRLEQLAEEATQGTLASMQMVPAGPPRPGLPTVTGHTPGRGQGVPGYMGRNRSPTTSPWAANCPTWAHMMYYIFSQVPGSTK